MQLNSKHAKASSSPYSTDLLAYNPLRRLDFQIWQFLCPRLRRHFIFAHARGVICILCACARDNNGTLTYGEEEDCVPLMHINVHGKRSTHWLYYKFGLSSPITSSCRLFNMYGRYRRRGFKLSHYYIHT